MIIGLVVKKTFDNDFCRHAYTMYIQQKYGYTPLTLDEALDGRDLKYTSETDLIIALEDYTDAIAFKSLGDKYPILGITQKTSWIGEPLSDLCDYVVCHISTIDELHKDINDGIAALAEQVGYVSTKIRKGITRTT